MRQLETYVPSRSTDTPLPCAVLACAQENDARLAPGHLASWEVFAPPGRFEEVQLPDAPQSRPAWSTPHRYLLDAPAPFLEMLAARCALIASTSARPDMSPSGAARLSGSSRTR